MIRKFTDKELFRFRYRELTDRQREFLDFIILYEKSYGFPPTFREIAIEMEISSKGTVTDMVDKLIDKGVLIREKRKIRGLKVGIGKEQ